MLVHNPKYMYRIDDGLVCASSELLAHVVTQKQMLFGLFSTYLLDQSAVRISSAILTPIKSTYCKQSISCNLQLVGIIQPQRK